MAKRVQVKVSPSGDQAETAEERHGRYGYVRPPFQAECNSCPWTAGADTEEDAQAAADDHKALHRAEAKENTAK